jgi:hypothetical protein
MAQKSRFLQGVFVNDELRWRIRQCLTVGEIQLLLCGVVEIDVEDWKASAQHKGGYSKDSKQVKWFWVVVEAMSATQRAALLHFATGSARAPATGFAQLMGYGGNRQPFTLQSVDGPPTRLPTAATCFNTLRLAAYRTQAELKQKLLQAVAGSSGFDENAIAV